MLRSIAALIAIQCERIHSCERNPNGNSERNIKDAKDRIDAMVSVHLPHGSGIDRGCEVDLSKSNSSRLVLKVPYHAMDENGHYCGWFDYKVVASQDFNGLRLSVTGGRERDRDYIQQVLYSHLSQEIEG